MNTELITNNFQNEIQVYNKHLGLWSETRTPMCKLIECPYDIDGADPRLEFDFLNGAGFLAMVWLSLTFNS